MITEKTKQSANKRIAGKRIIHDWILVKSKLPETDRNVLMYHEIETVEEGIFPYIEIGYLTQTIDENQKAVFEWKDKEHNSLSSPIYWMPLPSPPADQCKFYNFPEI